MAEQELVFGHTSGDQFTFGDSNLTDGTTSSSVDSSGLSQEQVDAIQQYLEQYTGNLTQQVQAVADQYGISFDQAMSQFGDQFSSLNTYVNNLNSQYNTNFANIQDQIVTQQQAYTSGFDDLNDYINSLNKSYNTEFSNITDVINANNKAAEENFTSIEDYLEDLNTTYSGQFEDMNTYLNDLNETYTGQFNSLNEAIAAIQEEMREPTLEEMTQLYQMYAQEKLGEKKQAFFKPLMSQFFGQTGDLSSGMGLFNPTGEQVAKKKVSGGIDELIAKGLLK